ncbi:MAG TPA: hypothetical protein PLD59_06595 [Tepidisphaeraceae bacterium]|nr:hypothetical protein [Tepidisphaeraceae bacterium]
MLRNDQIEQLVTTISAMSRPVLIEQFRSYPARFPLDLTDDFLQSASIERLRHIFLAVCLQNQKLPFRDAVAA